MVINLIKVILFVCSFIPSQADAAVFAGLAKAPGANYVHALRWYNHMKSYGNDTAK